MCDEKSCSDCRNAKWGEVIWDRGYCEVTYDQIEYYGNTCEEFEDEE